ncbi:hypothetical protein F4810DRAFT_712306 [Camillea tinctor]|nr:hypothetical protein F4810DRAFT_712306 [Camillea tinctor]
MPSTELQGISDKMEEFGNKVGRVIRAIWLRNDPVFVLFHQLPYAEAVCLIGASKSVSDEYNTAFKNFEGAVMRTSKSKDSDFEFLRLLFTAWEKRPVVVAFPDHIAALALKKHVSLLDKSTKAQHLRYHLWMAQGRKDELWPHQSNKALQESLNGEPIMHHRLPEDFRIYVCAQCGDHPTTFCKQCCVRAKGLMSTAVGYCTISCQKTHWAKHKAHCEPMARLKRGAEIFFEVFGYYSKACYTQNVRKISAKNGVVTAALGNLDALAYQGKHVLWKFPTALAPNEEIGEAVMYNETGKDIFTVARPLLELLIRSPKYKLEKLSFRPKNCQLAVNFKCNAFHSFNTLRSHEVLVITTPSGYKSVFDPACAKFGWDEYLAPWASYKHQRVSRVKKLVPFEPEESIAIDKYSNEQSSPAYAAYISKESILACAANEVKMVASKYGGIEAVLSNEASITAAREKLISDAKWAIDSRAVSLRRGLKHKLFFDYNFRLCATRNAATHSMMSKVWFTDLQFDGLEAEPLVLRQLWQDRLEAVLYPLDPEQFRVENVFDCKALSVKDADSDQEEEEEEDDAEPSSPRPILPPGVKYGSREHALLCLNRQI